MPELIAKCWQEKNVNFSVKYTVDSVINFPIKVSLQKINSADLSVFINGKSAYLTNYIREIF